VEDHRPVKVNGKLTSAGSGFDRPWLGSDGSVERILNSSLFPDSLKVTDRNYGKQFSGFQ
jgi:hypothetical protein